MNNPGKHDEYEMSPTSQITRFCTHSLLYKKARLSLPKLINKTNKRIRLYFPLSRVLVVDYVLFSFHCLDWGIRLVSIDSLIDFDHSNFYIIWLQRFVQWNWCRIIAYSFIRGRLLCVMSFLAMYKVIFSFHRPREAIDRDYMYSNIQQLFLIDSMKGDKIDGNRFFSCANNHIFTVQVHNRKKRLF